jgi:hypothetical protein
LLTRGLGQSALSVASLSLIGRSARGRAGLAMGAYAFLTSLGFIAAFGVLRKVIKAQPDDWRAPWAGIGVGVLVFGAIAMLLVWQRELDGEAGTSGDNSLDSVDKTLGKALRTPAFWAFAIGTSFYGMVVAGTSLFNESILAELKFSKDVFLNVTLIGIPVGLTANLLGGWAATRVALGRLLGGALLLFAVALACFPLVQTETQVYVYACALAAAGGVITVCFFTVWRRAFGTSHLGRIQGAAQLLTVLFSAAGPYLFAAVKTRLHAYAPLFPVLAGVATALALFAWLTRTDESSRRKPA